uniref:Uncharacterized protein n=1 Tax=Arundo donax TaxID=35708 RepID=A0A0A8YKL4_ARUDO
MILIHLDLKYFSQVLFSPSQVIPSDFMSLLLLADAFVIYGGWMWRLDLLESDLPELYLSFYLSTCYCW